jgi:LL-diaminopimelate aminotransferase
LAVNYAIVLPLLHECVINCHAVCQTPRENPPYLFAEIDRKRDEMVAKGVDIINMGVGDPDRPTPSHIVQAMHEAIDDPATHNYPPYQGTKDFREAAARWMERRFGVTGLNPNTK